MIRNFSRSSGNVLVFILLAVFLLGALAAMLLRSNATTEDTGQAEQDRIVAAEIMRYTSGMAQAVSSLQMRGCSETEISFQSTLWTDSGFTYNNPNAPTNRRCHVFDPAGAGYQFKRIPGGTTFRDYNINGNNSVTNVGLNTTPAGRDLIIQARGFSESVCRILNKELNVQSFAEDGIRGDLQFLGVYNAGGTIGDDGVNPGYLTGKKSGCFIATTFGGYTYPTYVFYNVLIAR